MIAQGWTLEKTHDIAVLLKACAAYDAEWATLAAEAAVLNEYIVAGRYPGDIVFDDIGSVEAAEALEAVRRIQARVEALMGLV